MPKRGKKYLESQKKIDITKRHALAEAVQVALESSFVKFVVDHL